MLRKGAGQKNIYDQTRKAQTTVPKQVEQRRQAQVKQMEALRQEFNAQLKTHTQVIQQGFTEAEHQAHLGEFLQSGYLPNFFKKQYREHGLKSNAVASCYRRFLQDKYLTEEQRDFICWTQTKGIEVQRKPGREDEYVFITDKKDQVD